MNQIRIVLFPKASIVHSSFLCGSQQHHFINRIMVVTCTTSRNQTGCNVYQKRSRRTGSSSLAAYPSPYTITASNLNRKWTERDLTIVSTMNACGVCSFVGWRCVATHVDLENTVKYRSFYKCIICDGAPSVDEGFPLMKVMSTDQHLHLVCVNQITMWWSILHVQVCTGLCVGSTWLFNQYHYIAINDSALGIWSF